MKILKKATFWFCCLAVMVIINNMVGNDDKNIILICFNPILEKIPLDFMNSGPKFAKLDGWRDISIYWYIGSFLTMMLYGLVIDTIIFVGKKFKK